MPSRTGCFAAKVAAATSPGKPGCAASDMAGIFLCSSPRAYFRRQFCPTVRRAACVGRKTIPQQAGRKRPKAGKEQNLSNMKNMNYNKLQALEANTAAIETAYQVRNEKRTATAAERETLSLYSGFGGIKEVLDLETNAPMPDKMKQALDRLVCVLQTIAQGDETLYKELVDSIKTSVLTAFYTPKFLIEAVANQIQATFQTHGLQMKSFLEPSAGIGGFLPVAMPDTYKAAVEKDLATGLVLSALQPDTQTVIGGFETIDAQELEYGTFDVIASNIPFGTINVFDADFERRGTPYRQSLKAIHNYFFIKAMELLNEGGLLAFVTSRGVADSPTNRFVRDYLVHHAHIITALRLPDTLFMQTGGIEVGSDLIILQKDSRKQNLTTRERLFLEVCKERTPQGMEMEHSNKAFTLPQSTLATGTTIGTNQFGKVVRKYEWNGMEEAIQQRLAEILKANFTHYFKPSLFGRQKQAQPQQGTMLSLFDLFGEATAAAQPKPNTGKRPYTDKMPDWLKDGALVLFEGQLGTIQSRRADRFYELAAWFNPIKVNGADMERAKDYLPVRKAYFELSESEAETRTEQPLLRERLNEVYDAFVSKWGNFHTDGNKELMTLDSMGLEVYSIEMQVHGEVMKADIMREPVAFKKIDVSVRLTPMEALASSLNYYGRVSMDYLTQTTGCNESEVIEALEGEMFYNPETGAWEEKGRILAGNVVEKCKLFAGHIHTLTGKARIWTERTVKALEDVTPELIPYEELDFNMGERWIPTEVYADFAEHLFDVKVDVVYFDVNDTYVISLHGYSPTAYNIYASHGYTGEKLFAHALHDTVPEIKKEVMRGGEWVKVPDEEAMQEAATKIQEIRDKFNAWLDSQPIAVRDELVRLYNERFNCYVRPSYDGSAQTFPGLSFAQFPYDDLYPSQKDAIWMIKQNGGGVCWHEVGAGKTMVMCVAAYEMKRLGLVQKPMIIGLKANVHEIADCFRKAYPSAKLLYPGKEDFTPANREELFSKIKNNNWDCIILTHDQFAKIPQSEETMYGIMQQELDDVERSLQVLEDSGMGWRNRRMQKGLEKRQENLTSSLQSLKMRMEEKKDNGIDFHSMGIDHIFVDECHYFKNLMFQTRHTRVAGIGNNQGSQRAMNLLIAIRDIQKRTGKDLGATFLSGTVVVNALTELYVLFKYLRPKELAKQRVSCFDAWAAIFTKKTTDYELNVTGSIKRKERFRTYIKVPELAAFLREITDYRTAEMINLDIPDKNVRFLSDKPTVEQEAMIERLVRFAHSGEWSDLGLEAPAPEHMDKAKMLIATNVARKMALDMRLLGNQFSDDPANKASRCAQTIYEYYVKSNAHRGTQFVFSDLSTYKPNEWNVCQDIKDKLVEMGIPANEIQFIQTAKTEKARKKIFEGMNNGTIRVLFGSTSMLGTGVNAQQRAVAVHHLEVPWRPADLEQRNGRAVRKGNTVKLWGGNVVDIIIYGTEKTLDAYKFNLLRNKQLFINQINNGTIAVRRIDEDGLDEDTGMNFAEFVAILSGNTDLLDKAKLDNKIMQLEKEQAAFNKERYRAERKAESDRQEIDTCKRNIGRMTEDWEYFNTHKENCAIEINGNSQLTTEETGRALHSISRKHRGDFTPIGSYNGLRLLVRSEYRLDGSFDRNIFFVEGKSGLKYKCGMSGSLPPSFAAAAAFPQATLENIPKLMERQAERQKHLEEEITTLQQVMARRWGKEEELKRLKQECKELQERINRTLEEAERPVEPMPNAEPVTIPAA